MVARKTTVRLYNGRIYAEFEYEHAERVMKAHCGWEVADPQFVFEGGELVRTNTKKKNAKT